MTRAQKYKIYTLMSQCIVKSSFYRQAIQNIAKSKKDFYHGSFEVRIKGVKTIYDDLTPEETILILTGKLKQQDKLLLSYEKQLK